MLKLVIYNDAVVARQNEVAVSERIHSFEEVISGLTEMQAVREAKRCLSCGNCFECDNCLAACPETAITKLGVGLGYEVNFERCTGCAVCYEQCPCHAIEMVPESTNRVPQHPA
jgi:Pyruvate/2-oxoacid:ferredoxin oxidoreductase delta subunit